MINITPEDYAIFLAQGQMAGDRIVYTNKEGKNYTITVRKPLESMVEITPTINGDMLMSTNDSNIKGQFFVVSHDGYVKSSFDAEVVAAAVPVPDPESKIPFTTKDYQNLIATHESAICAGDKVKCGQYTVEFRSAGVPVNEATPTIDASTLSSSHYGGISEKFVLIYDNEVQCTMYVCLTGQDDGSDVGMA